MGGEPGQWAQGQVALGSLGCHSKEANMWSESVGWDVGWDEPRSRVQGPWHCVEDKHVTH